MPPRADALSVSVLVLDDHRFMQQVICTMLHGLGVRAVTSASRVDEALRLLSVEKFDLVIVDYRLDGTSGAEFTRLVRGMRDGPRFVPIIACTANTTPKVIRELRDAGADEILTKPVSPRSLCAKINAVAQARRSFVSAPDFFGPDRRRKAKAKGPAVERRAGDDGERLLIG